MGRYGKGFEEEAETPIDECQIEAIWCWDSETGDKCLLDLKTGKEIGRWKKNGTQS